MEKQIHNKLKKDASRSDDFLSSYSIYIYIFKNIVCMVQALLIYSLGKIFLRFSIKNELKMRFSRNNSSTPLVDKISETTEPVLMKFLPHVPYTYS